MSYYRVRNIIIGGYKMKRIIFGLLLVSVSLIASGNSISLEKGAALYIKKCAICHGENADKTPIKNMKPIAGMEAEKVGRILVNYQNDITEDDLRISHGYNEIMVGATLYLSRKDIDNIAMYVSSLKK